MFNYFFAINKAANGKTDSVLYFTILCYIISLFIKDMPVVTNILMMLVFTLSIIGITKEKLKLSFLNNKVLLGVIAFYLIMMFSALFSNDKKEAIAILVRRLPLLFLPLSFYLINFKKEIWNKISLFYAITAGFATIFGFSYGVFCYFKTNDSGFLYNDNISEILGRQAVYLALYVSIAIVILIIHFNHNFEIKKFKPFIFITIIWLIFILFMLASRAAMLGLFIVFVISITNYIIRKKKYLEGVLLIFCIIVGFVLMSKLFPKTLNRFNGTTETNFQFDNKNVENHFNAAYDSSKWNGTNTRMAIWRCAYEVWLENPLIGTGIGDKNTELKKKYEEKKFWYGLSTNKNTHNQYLDILLSMGIIGEIIFIFLFLIWPLFTFWKQKQTFGMFVLIIIGICLITENMFDRYQGLVFIPFIFSLASKIVDKKEIEAS